MGSGKTTLLGEASDVLTARGVVHAAIDVDNLANGNVPDAYALEEQNLRAVVTNCRAAAIGHFVIAQALESHARRDALEGLFEELFEEVEVTVCRLTAPLAEMQRRIRLREPGMQQGTFVARVAALDALLNAVAVEDFSLANDGSRSVTDIATEILQKVGWIP
jgi:hypothetical protein